MKRNFVPKAFLCFFLVIFFVLPLAAEKNTKRAWML